MCFLGVFTWQPYYIPFIISKKILFIGLFISSVILNENNLSKISLNSLIYSNKNFQIVMSRFHVLLQRYSSFFLRVNFIEIKYYETLFRTKSRERRQRPKSRNIYRSYALIRKVNNATTYTPTKNNEKKNFFPELVNSNSRR